VTYLPLGFIYGLTTWAVWVEAGIGFLPTRSSWAGRSSDPRTRPDTDDVPAAGYTSSSIGILLYLLLNWSYTTAVFTDPGSPLQSQNGYSHLPTQEPRHNTSFTVKSTGDARFCKKCQARKPDRAHHCSTCRRCVLKMDHHCPWLATCVGLRNYKAFLLFLVYTTFFCWICFAVTSTWVWSEVLSDGQYTENLMPVNYVMLAVISGIIGLVLTGFTAWHFSLAWRGQTTIECLEKTRYLSPLRRSMEQQHYRQSQLHGNGTPSYGQQLREIHANALPGVTRPEEGEDTASSDGDLERGLTAQEALRRSYSHRERSRERERYENYLDEQDSEKLPNAFDLGWRRNLQHLFGSRPLFWPFPICNTSGDGWNWEPNPKWLDVRDQIRRQRESRWRAQERRDAAASAASPFSPSQAQAAEYRDRDYFASQKWHPTPGAIDDDDGQRHYLTTSAGVASVPVSGRRSPGKADQILGRDGRSYVDGGGAYLGMEAKGRAGSGMSMETLRRRGSEDGGGGDGEGLERYEVSGDDDDGLSRTEERRSAEREGGGREEDAWREW
jgi:ribosomal protein L40E